MVKKSNTEKPIGRNYPEPRFSINKHFEVIFCVLTYKNDKDICDFVLQAKTACHFSYKIIIINSHYDDETERNIETVAQANDCIFLDVPNKGYGSGNNVGIAYAVEHYDFSYLVVSNADILIRQMDLASLNGLPDSPFLLAPKIICKTGKKQNPFLIKNNRLYNWLIYRGFATNWKFPILLGLAINKCNRLFQRPKPKRKIFACHGSFVIFNRRAIEELFPVYDENIFLFGEEEDIAYKAKEKNIPSFYFPEIVVYHKEDGSIKLSDINVYKLSKESTIYVYTKWKKRRAQ
jgi:GT2 family glycosyltransferase